MDENRYRSRGSLIFPLILIIIGLVFLLNNIGALPGDFWDSLILFWPVLLILFGLDAIYRREGIVAAVFLIGLGAVFLLSNLGYLRVNVWEIVIRLWPIFLVAIGMDIVIGRRSAIGALVGVILVLALLLGALWWFVASPDLGQLPTTLEISEGLEGAGQARVTIDIATGSLRLNAQSEPNGLVTGVVRLPGSPQLSHDLDIIDQTAVFSLQGESYVSTFFPGGADDGWNYDLSLSPAMPLELATNTGAGLSQLDLSGLIITSLDVSYGVGGLTVVLPEEAQFSGEIDGAIGQIVLLVPRSLGVRLTVDTGLAHLSLPDDFNSEAGVHTSPDYNRAEQRVDLEVRQAIGNVRVRYVGEE